MFEKKYYLKSPLIGESRKYKEKIRKILFSETGYTCAMCGEKLEPSTANIEEDVKTNLQIAHIYGLKNFSNVGVNNYFHIDEKEKLNSYENLIILCTKDHRNYDRNPSYDKYCNILELKRKVSKFEDAETYVYKSLFILSDNVNDMYKGFKLDIIDDDLIIKTFLKKISENKLTDINKENERNKLKTYVKYIDEYFNEVDADLGTRILKIFATAYKKIREITRESNEILKQLETNPIIKILNIETILYQALITYCIWKCEVLEKNVTSK